MFSLVLVLYLLFLQYFATLSATSLSSHKKLEPPLSTVCTGRPNCRESFEMASYSKSNVKRKRAVLSVKDELNVRDMVRRKISKTDIMLKYNIAINTI